MNTTYYGKWQEVSEFEGFCTLWAQRLKSVFCWIFCCTNTFFKNSIFVQNCTVVDMRALFKTNIDRKACFFHVLKRFSSSTSLSYFDLPQPPKVYKLSEMGLTSSIPGCDFAACQPFRIFPRSTLQTIQNELRQVFVLFFYIFRKG